MSTTDELVLRLSGGIEKNKQQKEWYRLNKLDFEHIQFYESYHGIRPDVGKLGSFTFMLGIDVSRWSETYTIGYGNHIDDPTNSEFRYYYRGNTCEKYKLAYSIYHLFEVIEQIYKKEGGLEYLKDIFL